MDHIESCQSQQNTLINKLKIKKSNIRLEHLFRLWSIRHITVRRLTQLAYRSLSTVLACSHPIRSVGGSQQSDHLGPVLFVMPVDDMAKSLSSEINIWYIDDVTLCGQSESVFADVRKYVAELTKIGHEVDPCESIHMRNPAYLFTEMETTLASDVSGQSRT